MTNEPISEYMVGLVSAPNYEEAEKISMALIKKNLAACCTIIKGAVSIYKWKGKTEKAQECMIVIKTKSSIFSELIEEVLRKHSYDIPEIIGLPITEGFNGYFGWIDENTRLDTHQINI